jgi:hypothetical protein
MILKSHSIILFIDRDGFDVHQDVLASAPKFNFTPDLVINSDVIDKGKLSNLIGTLIQINKIVSSSLVVVLSDNIIFTKDLTIPASKSTTQNGKEATQPKNGDIQSKDEEQEVQSFLENIPFEDVMARVIKTGNMNRIVAVNRDLVLAITEAFVNKGSSTEVVVPGFMYGQSINFAAGLTSANIKAILENTETLKIGNLLIDQEKIINFKPLEDKPISSLVDAKIDSNDIKKPKNLRQYILAGVFVLLLVVLGIVYYFSVASQKPAPKIKNNPVNSKISPTVVPASDQTPIASVSADLKDIKVTIAVNSQTDGKLILLKSGLVKIGLQDIASEVSQAAIPGKSSVIFSQDIPADLRNNIIVEIKKILPDISILENQDADFTINIIVGKT